MMPISLFPLRMVARLAAAPAAADPEVHPVARALAMRETGDPFAGAPVMRRSIRIGVCTSLSRGFLRELIRAVRASPDAPALSFYEATPQAVLKAVRRGEVDVGVVYGSDGFGALRHEALWSERLMAVLPEGHPMFRDNAATPDRLRRETVLVCGEPAERDVQIAFLEQVLGGPPADLQCLPVERETLFNLVGLGFGVAFTTGSALGTFYPGVVYRPLVAPDDSVAFHLVWREPSHCEELGPFLATARLLAARAALSPPRPDLAQAQAQ